MEKPLREVIRSAEFALRQKAWGRIRVRPGLPAVSSTSRENPFYSLILNRSFGPAELAQISTVVDIGSRNGSYLPALAETCPHARVIGIELDGGRRHWNGYRRADYGEAQARILRSWGREARYIWRDILKCSSETFGFSHDSRILMTFFYPFVSETPCAGWGLPSRYADYEAVVRHLLTIAREIPDVKTDLLSVHQGEWEAELAGRVYESTGLVPEERRVERTEFEPFWPAEHDTFVFKVRLH